MRTEGEALRLRLGPAAATWVAAVGDGGLDEYKPATPMSRRKGGDSRGLGPAAAAVGVVKMAWQVGPVALTVGVA